MEKEDFELMMNKYIKTSGHKKLKNYVREIFESNYFQDFVKTIRKKYKIPPNGFDSENDQVFPPKLWKLSNNTKQRTLFNNEIKKICKRYGIHILDGLGIFEDYIFYNETDFAVDFDSHGLCITSDIPEEKEEPWSKDVREFNDLLYPIAIRISPNASLRDILDYIKTTYNYQISYLQKKYKNNNIKLGKFRKRKVSIQKRNDFIYQNQNLPKQEIMRLVTNKFGSENSIDYGYIGKIISQENKRRKEL